MTNRNSDFVNRTHVRALAAKRNARVQTIASVRVKPVVAASEEQTDKRDPASIIFDHMSLILEPGLLPLVESALRAKASAMASKLKSGKYDEITRVVSKERKMLEELNSAYAVITAFNAAAEPESDD